MSKLTEFFGRKDELGTDEFSMPTIGSRAGGVDEQLNPQALSSIGERIGEENESLRNLLVDTGRKIGELDELKDAFGKIVVPFNKTLRALEQEKSHNLSLRDALEESRAAYQTLRDQYYAIEKKATAFETETSRLTEELEVSRENARMLESSRSELMNEIASKQAQILELERLLSQESAQRKALSENKRMLTDQGEIAERRIVDLEAELAAAKEKLALLEDDKRQLQISLDQALNEGARLSRRLTESENTLTATRAQLGKAEASFAEASAERGRLSAALDEARDAHQAERNTLNMRLDGLQSRSGTAEKLLAEARQNLVARTEEVRAFDRKAVEATIARNNAEQKLSQIEAAHEARERQIKELEQLRTALGERTNALTKTLKARETALSRAEEKIQSLSERVGHLEADIQVSRTNIEKRVEDLNAALQRERMERSVAEGALEAARKDNSRLQSEVASLRGALRRGKTVEEQPPAPANTETLDLSRSRRTVVPADTETVVTAIKP